MQKDERDLLEVLTFELKFLEDGGYGQSPRSPWRPQLIFEDSPTCMNFNSEDHGPCSDCVLIQLVPREFRSAQIPCRHIPLDSSGETLDSLYRCGDQGEIEEVVRNWLGTTIHRLEGERAVAQRTLGNQSTPSAGTSEGTPLYQEQNPKCANPTCPTAFHWTGGGKFFRFRPESVPAGKSDTTADLTKESHAVRHYWLCERCSQVFTLVYDQQSRAVVVRELWPELPVTKTRKELPAA